MFDYSKYFIYFLDIGVIPIKKNNKIIKIIKQNKRGNMKTFEIGIDMTIGKYITVKANSEKEAIEAAKKQAENDSNIGSSKNWHYVGIEEA